MDFDHSLLIKYLFHDLSEEEKEKLLNWRKEAASNEAFFETLIKLKLAHQYQYINASGKTFEALNKINKVLWKKHPLYFIKRAINYAAILIVLFYSANVTKSYLHKETEYTTISVPEGECIKKFDLSDGTAVWLNESSTLKIPKSFSENKRYVKLEGEAYFDVKKNKHSNFIVDASSIKIKVLGTSFNLKNRKEDGVVETILVTGKVFLIDKQGNPVYNMFPGEKVIYSPDKNECIVKTIDTNVSTAWHLNQLTFENATLREIVNKLSLIFDVNINLESKKLADRKYRCVINRDETLQQVLDILSYLAPIDYQIEGDEVFIRE
ncbi:FecR family protein [Massilibacteroides sp.]|uniref:FecR family protein n=1 Tax=Massilibacteroides sp. TaxID=2034766 RepID=UPI00262676EB|nr:FecR family protein [Massilibacteroides sp.]MDD4514381.1 FecR family protein [Massilibacteroides sp.]